MPCTYFESPEEIAARNNRFPSPIEREVKAREIVEAMLCGVLHAIEDSGLSWDVWDSFDEQESGVLADEIERWWVEHRKKDEARKLKEAKTQEKIKRDALKKLTAEERKALGL